jgi:hypothetical protein
MGFGGPSDCICRLLSVSQIRRPGALAKVQMTPGGAARAAVALAGMAVNGLVGRRAVAVIPGRLSVSRSDAAHPAWRSL